MRKELSSEAEYHLSLFYWYTERVEFLSNRLSGTDYQTILNKRFKDQHLDSEYDFQVVFDEHPVVSDLNSEVSKVITDQEFIEAVVKHRRRLITEKNRLIKEQGKANPSELKKFLQWDLLHQTTKPSPFNS